MSDLIYGWDASHYDSPPNASRMIQEGFSFYTHKLGGDANDPEANDAWDNVRDYRDHLLVGGYWVVRPDLHSDATADADAFLARADSQCPTWRNAPFILQADCESWGDSSGRKKPNKSHIKTFCDRLRSKAPKLMPIVYASKGDYGDSLTGLPYPLWNARYSLSYKTGTASGLYAQALAAGSGWGSYSGQTPAIWQFTSSATIAGQTTCDANAYRGSLAQLTALLAPGWSNDMEISDLIDGLNNNSALRKAFVGALLNTDGVLPAPSGAGADSIKNNPQWAGVSFLQNIYDGVVATRAYAAKAAGQDIDEQALAQALLPSLVAGIVAALPAEGDPISQDEVTAAVKAAFAEAFGQHPAA